MAISREEIDSSIGWVEILSDLRDEKTCKLEDASILFKTFLNLIKGRNLKLACPELFKNINPQNIHQFINSPHVSKSLEEHYLRFWTTNKYLKVDRYALEIFGNLAKIIENSRL